MNANYLSILPKIHYEKKQRVGRGVGSGRGKESGRGKKGTKARNKVAKGFEGGQTTLIRRAPKFGKAKKGPLSHTEIHDITTDNIFYMLQKNNKGELNLKVKNKKYTKLLLGKVYTNAKDFSGLTKVIVDKISKGAKKFLESINCKING